jgi:hypothetical protein
MTGSRLRETPMFLVAVSDVRRPQRIEDEADTHP